MVILRELDGAKDYPLVIHPVGSDWERQVRAHYTRADGTLNINGYYSEMFGFPVNSSDFESGGSHTDSDSSGNDSDCVIISQSEFSSNNPNNRFLIVADSVATISTSMEISSREGCPELMFDASGDHIFPFYWSSAPRLIKGTRVDAINEYERQAVATFSRFHVMNSGKLIAREYKPHSHGEYMSSMSTLSAQQRAVLVLKARAQTERAASSADAMAQLVVKEGGAQGTKRKNQEGSTRISLEIPKKKRQLITIEQEGEDIDDQPLKSKRMPRNKNSVPPHSGEGGSSTIAKDKLPFITCCPSKPELRKGKKSNLSKSLWTEDFDSFSVVNESFQKYARTSSLSDLDFEDLRQAAMDHHIQGAMLSYYLSTRQELDTIEARNKMESADNGLSALEKEYVAARSKFEEDLAAMKARQEEAVKAAAKAKDDEVAALKGKVKTLEDELVVATQGKEEASQYDDGFRFAVDQMKVVFPKVDIVKLGKLDSLHQIVDGKLVPFVPPASN
ncbi:hypothetical protein TSUD_189390 [Trifolium subterraneum]|uniref:Uncharacterized protein n=1 Tax=Trifolium subterraneum TaxID=3900 RepID=A0A2Z6M7F6_TRISU|nr:hypothetical protein TSUD_189390 [Trifolium subterraneum]